MLGLLPCGFNYILSPSGIGISCTQMICLTVIYAFSIVLCFFFALDIEHKYTNCATNLKLLSRLFNRFYFFPTF